MSSNMYSKIVLIFTIITVTSTFSMLPEEEGYLSKIKNGTSYVIEGFYHGTAKTVLKNPLSVCFNLWRLWIEKDFIKDNPGRSVGIATGLIVPVLYHGFCRDKLQNSLLQTLVDVPFEVGLAFQKICFDREGIRNHPWISTFVAFDLIQTFARNYNERN